MPRPTPDDEYAPGFADDPSADVPPEETFWKTYSPHLELPIASLLSVFAHVAILGVFTSILLAASCAFIGQDKKPVPITLVDMGDADSGRGNPADAGDPAGEKNAVKPVTPQVIEPVTKPKPDALPEVSVDLAKPNFDDPSPNVFENPAQAVQLKALNDTLNQKLDGPVGNEKGAGPGTKVGPGGIGNDSSRARSNRWIMRFKTDSGQDYLDQLAGLGAVVLVPVPPANTQLMAFRPPFQPGTGKIVSDTDIGTQFGGVQFMDVKRDSARQVAAVLRLSYAPDAFWAVFPPDLERDMAGKEKAFNNMPTERIKETVFAVVRRGNKYEMAVVRQELK